MSYFLNTFRTPKPGKAAELADAMQGSLEAIGGKGLVNVSVAAPNAAVNNMRVVGTVTLENESEADGLLDNIFGNGMAALRDRSNISDLCSQESMSLSKVIARSVEIPEDFQPKYINRNFISVKLGKLPDVLELTSGWNADINHRFIYNVSTPQGGPVSTVRVTHIVESFASLQELNNKIFADVRQQQLVDFMSASVTRSLGRITYVAR